MLELDDIILVLQIILLIYVVYRNKRLEAKVTAFDNLVAACNRLTAESDKAAAEIATLRTNAVDPAVVQALADSVNAKADSLTAAVTPPAPAAPAATPAS